MIHQIISERKSTVLFDKTKTINTEMLEALFEASRWASSSLNMQPWRFVISQREEESHKNFLSCLAPKNQEWAMHASMLVLTVAQTTSDYKNRKNIYAWHDTALAFSNLVFQATHLGLSVHPMGGFDRDKTVDILGIPKNYEPVIFAAVGYRADDDSFPMELLNREKSPRIRLPLNKTVFQEEFGNPAGFLENK